jgi:hypothetical protein
MEANTEGQQYQAAAVLYTRHSYVSFLYSLGAHSGFISSQTGDSIKTLGSDYGKYIEEADYMRNLVWQRIAKRQL